MAWRTAEYPLEEIKHQHHFLYSLAADLSMLRLLEAFLESVPQLLLQLYIVLGRQGCSLVQSKPGFLSIHDFASTLLMLPSCSFRDIVLLHECRLGLGGLSAVPAQISS